MGRLKRCSDFLHIVFESVRKGLAASIHLACIRIGSCNEVFHCDQVSGYLRDQIHEVFLLKADFIAHFRYEVEDLAV